MVAYCSEPSDGFQIRPSYRVPPCLSTNCCDRAGQTTSPSSSTTSGRATYRRSERFRPRIPSRTLSPFTSASKRRRPRRPRCTRLRASASNFLTRPRVSIPRISACDTSQSRTATSSFRTCSPRTAVVRRSSGSAITAWTCFKFPKSRFSRER